MECPDVYILSAAFSNAITHFEHDYLYDFLNVYAYAEPSTYIGTLVFRTSPFSAMNLCMIDLADLMTGKALKQNYP